MGFTQRQGAGKFTRDEASALIDQLVAAELPEEPVPTAKPTVAAPAPPKTVRSIRDIPAATLAAELERRGWTATPPP
jgi:hypothetical protein